MNTWRVLFSVSWTVSCLSCSWLLNEIVSRRRNVIICIYSNMLHKYSHKTLFSSTVCGARTVGTCLNEDPCPFLTCVCVCVSCELRAQWHRAEGWVRLRLEHEPESSCALYSCPLNINITKLYFPHKTNTVKLLYSGLIDSKICVYKIMHVCSSTSESHTHTVELYYRLHTIQSPLQLVLQ